MSIQTNRGPATGTFVRGDYPPDAGARLLAEIRAALDRYVILPDDHAATGVVLWIAATHAVPAWAHAARLVIRAPEKRCGKSRLLDLVEAMCHAPLLTVNASPSAVYRSIGSRQDDPPTLLLDEADTIFGAKAGDNEDLRGLLNAGHQRGRPALRYNAAANRVERIETFAMAALAGIGVMPDTIEDRAVVVRMRRRSPGEIVAPYRTRRDGPALDHLRARLNQWVRAHIDVLGQATPAMPVEDRAADTWEPLIAVADLAGGSWPAGAREAALALTENRDASTQQTPRTRLLADCRTAFGDADSLPTTELLERLKSDPEAPWATWAHTGLTPVRLAGMLREFDIRSDTIRFGPVDQAKGYRRGDFADAWDRYCPADEAPKASQAYQPYQTGNLPGQRTNQAGTDQESGPYHSRTNDSSGLDRYGSNSQAVPEPYHRESHSDEGRHTNGTAGTAGTAHRAHLSNTDDPSLPYDDRAQTDPTRTTEAHR